MALEAYNASIDYKSNLVSFYFNKNGVPFKHQMVAEWLSWHKKPVEGTFKKYIKYQQKDRSHWLVSWRSKEDREACCKAMGPDALEADVNPITNVLRRMEEFKLPHIRKGYYDIETDDRVPFQQALAGGARILCLTVKDDDTGIIYSYLLSEDTDEAEKDMLDKFVQAIEKNVDQLISWNGKHFDDPIIIERMRMLGCNTKVFRRILFFDMMLNFRKHNLNSAESGSEKQSFALNNVSFALGESIKDKDITKDPSLVEIKKQLLEGKKDLGGSGIYELWKNNPKLLQEYNIKDVELMPLIEKVSGYIELQYAVCQLCRIFPDNYSINASRFVDAFMLRLGHVLDYRFPSKWHDELKEAEKFKGAFCLLPQELGIHRDVYTFDFSALYPSIFKTFNLSPETKLGKIEDLGENVQGAKCPTGFVFDVSKKGIYAIAFEAMQKMRKEYQIKEKEAEPESPEEKMYARLSMGAKVVINSAYGIISSVFGRYHDPDIGESCTQCGVYLIKGVQEELVKLGMFPIAGDTDSLHFKGCSSERAIEILDRLNNIVIPKLVEDKGCINNYCKMEYEKCFDWVVFSTNGEGDPIKKRYVGQYKIYKNKVVTDGDPVIRGLEYRRGDSVKLARDLQYTIFKMLCSHEFNSMPYEELIVKWRTKILNDPLNIDDISISKSINIPLEAYTANAAHIRLAKELEEEGEDVAEGTKIKFYVKDGSKSPKEVKIATEYDNDVDRIDLWNKIYKPSMRLLAGAWPNIRWDVWKTKYPKVKVLPGQMSLF